MKKLLYISFLTSLLFTACIDNDDVEGELEIFEKPTLKNSGSELDKKIISLYDKYETYFKYEFEEKEYRWGWTGEEIEDYTVADINYVDRALDTIVKNVYEVFPEKFSKKYLSYKVLFVDSLYLDGSSKKLINYETGENYVIISNVSDRFETYDFKELNFEYLSLFIEDNFVKFSFPTEFYNVNSEAYNIISIRWDDPNDFGFLRRDRNTDNKPPTIAQDFGDYIAMIIHKTKDEKIALCEKQVMIKTKMNSVIKYFKENFNIDLPAIE